MLVVVAAVDVIYVVAATLWILVVLTAVAIGCRLIVKIRARRRRMRRLFGVVRVPRQLGRRIGVLLRSCDRAGRPYALATGKNAALRLHALLGQAR